LDIIEYLDPTGQEIVHRVPEEGSGEIVLGSQCIVRENQVAIFFRDGRALDVLGPGRHTLTTLNIPLLVNYLKIPFGTKSPFRAEVVFVSLKDYIDIPWQAPKPVPYRDAEFGMVRLDTEGKFAFRVARPPGAAPAPPSGATSGSTGGLEAGFSQFREIVGQQLTLSDDDEQVAVAGLDELHTQLTSLTSEMADVKAAHTALVDQFPWLDAPLRRALGTPAALQVLGQIAARSM
jgi:hypothetical protein